MIRPADLFDPVDRLAAWLPGELGWLPANVRAVLVVPLVVLTLCVAPRVAVRVVLPWLGRYLIGPAVALAAGVVAVAALTADFVLARLFRLFWLPLTVVHYAIGDLALAGTSGVHSVTRSSVFRAGRRLEQFSPGVLMFGGLLLAVLWSAGFCGRHPGGACTEPFAQWLHDVGALWHAMLA